MTKRKDKWSGKTRWKGYLSRVSFEAEQADGQHQLPKSYKAGCPESDHHFGGLNSSTPHNDFGEK